MSRLADLSITSPGFVRGFTLLTCAVLLLTACWLAWLARKRSQCAGERRGRRSLMLVVLPAVLLSQVLVTSVLALRINTVTPFATTLGEVAQLAVGAGHEQAPGGPQLAPIGTQTQSATPEATATPEDSASPEATASADPAYVAAFTEQDNGWRLASFSGPGSGVTDAVWAWVPRDYRPDDGKTYNVLTALHGQPATPEGLLNGFEVGPQLQATIDAGKIPPTIAVVPSLNVDSYQRSNPDCTDIVGHAKVGTWIQEDLPRMVRATFPNARTDRLGWALGGFSSGGFCATWTTIMRSDVYSTVMNLSGIDTMNVGALSTPELREENTVSRMLGSQPHQPIRIWAMAAQDDPIAHQAMVALAQAPRGPGDVVDLIEPETGGHGTALWKEQLSEFFSWWGVQPEAWGPGVRQSPAPEATSQATATATSSEPAADAQAADEPAERPAQPQRPHLLATFTGIRGAGTIGLFFLLTVALSVCCLLVRLPGLARLRGLRAGAQPGLRTGSDADEQPVRAVPAAEAGTAGRTVARRLLGWAGALSARGLPLLAACLCFALLVGLIGNRLGGFYPTWAVAWENLRPAF